MQARGREGIESYGTGMLMQGVLEGVAKLKEGPRGKAKAKARGEGEGEDVIATTLIEDFLGRIRQHHVLLEVLPDLIKLLRLGPIVKGACHVDIGGGMCPTR